MTSATSTDKLAWPNSGLDRRTALPDLIGRHEDFLFVTGLGNTSKEVAALTGDASRFFGIGGAMGSATMVGLGLALARPDKRVVVVTGDGEMLMSMGSLAVVGCVKPPNLAIVCVDNGHYGETGNQLTHTAMGVQLDRIATASGITSTMVAAKQEDLARGAELLRGTGMPVFILLRVKQGEAPGIGRNLNPVWLRQRFRMALTGKP